MLTVKTIFGRFNKQPLIELHPGAAANNDKQQMRLIKQCDTAFKNADEIVGLWNEGKINEIKDILPDCLQHNIQ